MALISFSCAAPVATWSPTVNPSYGGGYSRGKERFQPKAFAGSNLYSYNHGMTIDSRLLEWTALPAADMAALLTFLGLMHGGVHTFTFTDYEATAYTACRVINFASVPFKNLQRDYFQTTLELEVA
jgi:hypothetical protein